mmetsp:Transcript_67413/g.217726  ORF Transcript_67413/g.217726 Transcript_67413/m.217726 type:complete len:192 (-) Transcript_67413:57-632(-)
MAHITSTAAGPGFLRELVPAQMVLLLGLYVPIIGVVFYRMHFSKTRDSVAPHAGMAMLMAPASFFSFTHSAAGKPFGDWLGTVLFLLSTVFFLIAVRLLYVRRGLWIGAFDARYVAFTFPLASTATAALLASERLPACAGAGFRIWAGVLGVLCVAVVTSVLLRFAAFLGPAMLAEARPPQAAKDATTKVE